MPVTFIIVWILFEINEKICFVSRLYCLCSSIFTGSRSYISCVGDLVLRFLVLEFCSSRAARSAPSFSLNFSARAGAGLDFQVRRCWFFWSSLPLLNRCLPSVSMFGLVECAADFVFPSWFCVSRSWVLICFCMRTQLFTLVLYPAACVCGQSSVIPGPRARTGTRWNDPSLVSAQNSVRFLSSTEPWCRFLLSRVVCAIKSSCCRC
jgi:hypothetical protein